MKVIYFANSDWYLYNFRLSLISRVRKMGHEVLLITPTGEYASSFEKLGMRWCALSMNRRSANPFKELLVLVQLIRLYRIERPQIVHHFSLKCVIYGTIAATVTGVDRIINAITGFGYTFTAENSTAKSLKYLISNLLKFLFKNRRTKIIVQNMDDYQLLDNCIDIETERLFLIRGSGVNIKSFHPSEKPAYPDKNIIVLFAARLLVDKGVREYVRAAKLIAEKRKDVTFLLAGRTDPGNPNTITESELDIWREGEIPKLLGHVEDMCQLLKSVDLVVLPSYREGLPRSLIEATACGIAIVTTTVPGCQEVVEHGVNGFLVPPKDTKALCSSINILLDSADLRYKMGMFGREKAEKMYDEEIIISETIKIY